MKKLSYLFLALIIVACSSDDGGGNEQSSCPIYLDSNGVTIKACEDANVGDIGVVNGVTYTVLDEEMLREMVNNEEDVTKVVTTKVSDMSEMFFLVLMMMVFGLLIISTKILVLGMSVMLLI